MQNPNWQGTSPESAANVWPGGQGGAVQTGMNMAQPEAAARTQHQDWHPGMTQAFPFGGQPGTTAAETQAQNISWQATPGMSQAGEQAVLPRVDVLETDSEFIYVFEVPGPDPEQINVEVSAREIALTGPESAAYQANRYHYLERPQGRYMRLLRTPANVSTNDATASYRNGELELHLPKKG